MKARRSAPAGERVINCDAKSRIVFPDPAEAVSIKRKDGLRSIAVQHAGNFPSDWFCTFMRSEKVLQRIQCEELPALAADAFHFFLQFKKECVVAVQDRSIGTKSWLETVVGLSFADAHQIKLVRIEIHGVDVGFVILIRHHPLESPLKKFRLYCIVHHEFQFFSNDRFHGAILEKLTEMKIKQFSFFTKCRRAGKNAGKKADRTVCRIVPAESGTQKRTIKYCTGGAEHDLYTTDKKGASRGIRSA